MADRDFSGIVRTVGGRVKQVSFLALVQGAAAPVLCDSAGTAIVHPLVSPGSHDSAGKYTFTLKDAYLRCTGAQAHYLAFEETVDLYAQMGGVFAGNSAAPANCSVRLKTAGANTDPSATGGFICVTLTFEDSGAYAL